MAAEACSFQHGLTRGLVGVQRPWPVPLCDPRSADLGHAPPLWLGTGMGHLLRHDELADDASM